MSRVQVLTTKKGDNTKRPNPGDIVSVHYTGKIIKWNCI